MSRKLLIHIGCHKTGTTSIQHNLAQNGEALAKQGLSFFYENAHSGERLLPDLHSWIGFVEKDKVVPHGMYVREPAKLADRLSQTQGDIILSSENFSFVFDEHRIAGLQEELAKVFSDIRIVCYLRRQDRHIVSHHQEGSKLFRKAEYDIFGHSTLSIPPYDPKHELYLDYDRRLSMWARAFGDQSLVLKVYDRKLLKNGDAVADFFDTIGIEDYNKVPDRNVSLGLQDIKLGHLINEAGLRHKQVLVNLLFATGRESRKMLPSQAVARAYYEHYRASNAALNARFKVSPHECLFEDDFSDYPETEQDRWPEEGANEVIRDLLRLFDANFTDLNADELRDAAMAIGKTKPAIAIKLLRIALALRPDGPIIRKKLQEYEKELREGRPTPAQAQK